MALTKVQIISNALTLIGKKPIVALGQDDLSDSAEQAFDLLYPANLSDSNWRFATTIAQLSLLNETPIVSTVSMWKYAYALPGDFLKLIKLYPLSYSFEIYENSTLYTSLNTTLYIEYISLVLETQLPAYFVRFFVYELATYLALTNAQNPTLAGILDKKATYFKAVARSADAQNRPQTPLQSAPILSVRGGDGVLVSN